MEKRKKGSAPAPRMKTIVKAHVTEEGFFIPASLVTKWTKWDGRYLEYLRDNGLVVFEKRESGAIWYQTESINRIFKEEKKYKSA